MSFQGRLASSEAAGSEPVRANGGAPPQAELENLIASIPDAVIVVDGQDIVRFVNPSARALLRDADDTLVGQQLGFAVTRNQVAEIEILVQGEPRRAQLRTVDCTWDGRPALLAMMRDVSEQRRLERVLESERAFSERRLKDALDAASGPIIVADRADRIVLVNRAAAALLRYRPSELLGRPVLEVVPGVASASEQERRHHRRAEGQVAVCRDGTQIPIEVVFTHFEDRGGSLVMLTIADVTVLRAHEQSLRERNAELMRLNQELTQFAYSVSHDLKAPLTTVTGLLHLGLEDLEDGDAAGCAENLTNALECCRRNASKIEAVLKIARAGADRLAPEPTDLAREIALIWRDLSASHPAPPSLRIAIEGEREFLCERQTVLTIFENLLSNALRFRDPAKPEHHVRIAGRLGPRALDIEIADNGIGIPKAQHPRVFAMFSRFSAASGSGLGLALVKKHVDRLHGRISFDSDAGGTRFRLWLPAENEES